MTPAQLFPTPRTAASKRVAELAGRLAELQREGRTARAASAADEAAIKEATTAVHSAEAQHKAFGGKQKSVDAARKRLAALQKDAEAHRDEARLLDGAVAVVQQELETHIRQHADSLRREVHDDAENVAARLVAAVQEIGEAHAAYVATGQRSVELERSINADALRTARVPDPPPALRDVARHAGEVAAAVRVPVVTSPDQVVTASELARHSAEANDE